MKKILAFVLLIMSANFLLCMESIDVQPQDETAGLTEKIAALYQAINEKPLELVHATADAPNSESQIASLMRADTKYGSDQIQVLWHAAGNGNLNIINFFIRNKINPSALYHWRAGVLYTALTHGHTAYAQKVLELSGIPPALDPTLWGDYIGHEGLHVKQKCIWKAFKVLSRDDERLHETNLNVCEWLFQNGLDGNKTINPGEPLYPKFGAISLCKVIGRIFHPGHKKRLLRMLNHEETSADDEDAQCDSDLE